MRNADAAHQKYAQAASAAISPLQQGHSRAAAPSNLAGSRQPGADHCLVYHPLFALPALTLHCLPLPPTTTNFHSYTRPCHWPSRSACQLDRGSVPTSPFQNTKRSSMRLRISSASSSESVSPWHRCLSLVHAEPCRCKRVEIDPSKIHQIGENFPLRRRRLHSSTSRHDFPRSPELRLHVQSCTDREASPWLRKKRDSPYQNAQFCGSIHQKLTRSPKVVHLIFTI